MALSNVRSWMPDACATNSCLSDACASVTSCIARMFNPLASPHYVVRSCNKWNGILIIYSNAKWMSSREIKCAWKMGHCSPLPFGSFFGRRIGAFRMGKRIIIYFMRVNCALVTLCVYALDSRRRMERFDRSGGDGGGIASDALEPKRFFLVFGMRSAHFGIVFMNFLYNKVMTCPLSPNTIDRLRCIFDLKKW